jgi:hypothetical protein
MIVLEEGSGSFYILFPVERKTVQYQIPCQLRLFFAVYISLSFASYWHLLSLFCFKPFTI